MMGLKHHRCLMTSTYEYAVNKNNTILLAEDILYTKDELLTLATNSIKIFRRTYGWEVYHKLNDEIYMTFVRFCNETIKKKESVFNFIERGYKKEMTNNVGIFKPKTKDEISSTKDLFKEDEITTIHEAVSNVTLVDIDKLEGHSKNREYQDERIDSLVYNIEQDGLLQPIVIMEIENNMYRIIAGHHRVLAYKKLRALHGNQYNEIQSIIIPKSSELDQLKYLMSTNSNPELDDNQKQALLETANSLYDSLTRIGEKPKGRKRDWLINITGLSQYYIRQNEGDVEEKKKTKPKTKPSFEDEVNSQISKLEKSYGWIFDNYVQLEDEEKKKIKNWIQDIESLLID